MTFSEFLIADNCENLVEYMKSIKSIDSWTINELAKVDKEFTEQIIKNIEHLEKFKDIIKNYEGKNFNDIDESDPNFNIIKLYVLTEYCIDARNLIRKNFYLRNYLKIY